MCVVVFICFYCCGDCLVCVLNVCDSVVLLL